MVRSPSVHDEEKLKKGPWTPEEDQKLVDCINRHGHANWRAVPKLAGLNRCGKSCRLRWKNYLQPDIKRGKFSDDEEKLIINLHSVLGNKWSKIASHLPGRTDNEIKNYWNTYISKKLLQMGIDPKTHKPRTDLNHLANLSQLLSASQFGNFMINPLDLFKLQTNTSQLANFHVLQNLLQILNTSTLPSLNYNNNSLNIGSQNFCQNSPNPTFINPKFPTNFQEIVGSSMLNDSGFDIQGLDTNNNIAINSSLDNYNNVNIETENYTLPKLLSTTASPETSSMVNHVETNNNNLSNATTPAHTSTMFEDWERLMEEGTSESYWNDILANGLLD